MDDLFEPLQVRDLPVLQLLQALISKKEAAYSI